MDLGQRIAQIPFWHQQIDLGNGVTTPGAQNTNRLLEQICLPEDLSGLSVLDLGARDGFFSFECEKRGASRVVALDYVPGDQTGFQLCKEILDSDVEFVNDSVYSIDKSVLGSFDVVLFLGLVYHLRHPVLAIDRIYDVLNLGGRMFLETHVIDGGLVDVTGKWVSMAEMNENLTNMQIAQFYAGGELNNDVSNFWAPNMTALTKIVSNSGFVVDSSWVDSFRGGLIATKIELDDEHPRFIDTAKSIQQPLNGNQISDILLKGEI